MRLQEYIDRESHEPNLFWQLDSGEHLNLLDEAIERIDELEEALEASKRELSGNPGRLQVINVMADAIRREQHRPAIRSVEWAQKAPERMATAALDASLPLITKILSKKVHELYPLGSQVSGDAPQRIVKLIESDEL